MKLVIRIDKMSLFMGGTPYYCRNDADKVRWIALKQGLIKVIRPTDTVKHLPQMDCFELIVEGV